MQKTSSDYVAYIRRLITAMLEVVRSLNYKKLKPGRPGKISLEDQLLMTLEKRARVPHLFSHWSVRAELTNLQPTVLSAFIEDMLCKSRAFTLPGKKKLYWVVEACKCTRLT